MKKLILFVLILNGLFLQAQIVNPSFENVTANKPDNWNTAANNYNSYYIKDTSAAKDGIHAAYIKGFGAQSYSIQGAVLGTFTMNTRPLTLIGWYKSNIVAGDSLVFYTNVYQSPVFTGAVANGYSYTTQSSAVYKQFTSTFSYANFPFTAVGQSGYVGIYFSGVNKDAENIAIPQTGTWAIIDSLAFTYSVTPTPTYVTLAENALNVNVEQLYPQPSSGMVFLVYTLKETTPVDLQVIDVTGKEVKTIFIGEKQTPGRFKAEVDLGNLAPGIYFTRLQAGNETRVTKIIKQ